MALPAKPLPTGTVTIAGAEVPIRAMARSEVRELRRFASDTDDAEPFIVSCGASVPLSEASEWLSSIDVDTGGELVDAILRLTGLVSEDPQPGSIGGGPTAGPSSEP